ncbi:MAG: hypothetical protein EAZ55_07735 [Cytophagales bacterium]|nr:MAG: hypothetical protein EAZ55_07735 [Cytophagales bacterium]
MNIPEIIDANTHITRSGKWFETTRDASLNALIKEMENANINKSLLVALPEVIENEFILECCEKYPKKLIPIAALNPKKLYRATLASTLLEIKEKNFKAIKLHNRLSQHNPLDDDFLALLEINNSLENPNVIFICSLFYSKDLYFDKTPPQIIHFLSNQFPKTTFLFMHAGGSWFLQVVEAIRDCPNAYLDLSFSISKYKESSFSIDLKYLINTFDQRLVWGSDFPEYLPKAAKQDFLSLTDATIPSEKIQNIMANNIKKILNL